MTAEPPTDRPPSGDVHFRLFFAATLLVALAACSSPQAEREQKITEAPPVEAVEARSGTLPLEERVSGIVKASNQVVIRPQIEAAVVAVPVESGERVEKGQLLVRLDDSQLREQLGQAEAAVRLAEAQARESRARVAELEAQATRWRELAAEEVVSRLDLETLEARLESALASADSASARVEQAQATARERRSLLAETEIRAPISGRIGQRNAELGMLVDSNTELFVIGGLERVKVEIPLTEVMLSRLREQMPVRLSSSAWGGVLEASLTRISPFLEEGSFSTVGEIEVDNSSDLLRPGMFVTVDVLYGESAEATLVPSSALWEDPRTGEQVVFVIDAAGGAPQAELGETAVPVERRRATVQAEGRETVGLTGVEPGEWVVTVGHQLLDGDPLEARVRAAEWRRVLELQSLQQENLLEDFMAKQQRMAQTIGVEPPSSDAFAASAQEAAQEAAQQEAAREATPEEMGATDRSATDASSEAENLAAAD